MPSVVLLSHPYCADADEGPSERVRRRFALPYFGRTLAENLGGPLGIAVAEPLRSGSIFGAAVVSDCSLLRHPGVLFFNLQS